MAIWRTSIACWTTKSTHIRTHRTRITYCFSTATIVMRKHPIIKLRVHYLHRQCMCNGSLTLEVTLYTTAMRWRYDYITIRLKHLFQMGPRALNTTRSWGDTIRRRLNTLLPLSSLQTAEESLAFQIVYSLQPARDANCDCTIPLAHSVMLKPDQLDVLPNQRVAAE